MAAKELVYSFQEVEATVNRFTLDYYMSLALELFKNEQYDDFCGVRDIIESVLGRPKEKTDVMQAKIRVLQFLSRINEGEKLDMTFEADESITPLESALMLLDGMNEEFNLPQPGFENVCAALKEMIVKLFIKNNEFDKAKKVLNEQFAKQKVGKKSIFMSLIRQKTNKHKVIEQIDFQQFKEEMLAFCLSLCPYHVPYLHKAATRLINERLKERNDKAAGPEEQGGGEQADGPEVEDTGEQTAELEEEDESDKAGPDEVEKDKAAATSASPQITMVQSLPGKHTVIQRHRLEAVYRTLAAGSDEKTFAQLEEEVEEEEQQQEQQIYLHLSESEQDGLFQRNSGSPMEASPADQPPQTDAVPETQAGSLSKAPPVLKTRQPYTLANLVVLPDSCLGSQCLGASQEPETNDRAEEPPESPAKHTEEDSQSLLTDNKITAPTWKTRKASRTHSRASTSLAELSSDSEDDPPVVSSHNRSNTSLSRTPTKSKQPLAFSVTPVQKRRKEATSSPLRKDPDAFCISDASLDSSPNKPSPHPVPQTSSSPRNQSLSHAKWKELYNTAKESKEVWTDEESCVGSTKRSHNESMSDGSKKRKWTDSETNKLKEGVRKFGEGNWSSIKAYYNFTDRSNVNLKDRWRTMKKLKMV